MHILQIKTLRHLPKCMSSHKAIMVIEWKEHYYKWVIPPTLATISMFHGHETTLRIVNLVLLRINCQVPV